MSRFDKPTKIPLWAVDDIVDQTEGTNNAIEPPAERTAEGWVFQERLPRNYLNWQQRQYGNWIGHLNGWRAKIIVQQTGLIQTFELEGVKAGDAVIAITNRVGTGGAKLLTADIRADGLLRLEFDTQPGFNHEITYYAWTG